MNPYKPTLWQDDIYDEATGELIQEGTPMSRTQFHNMETGIFGNDAFASVLLQQTLQHKRKLSDLEGEVKEITLTNNQAYPFNNSAQTVAMTKQRDTLNYRVIVEVVSSVGMVGAVEVYDKALNGFKVRYSGSATSAIVRCYIQGGMI